MKSHYNISIPKPCHENWSTMTPKEKGRFCQSCSKTVVDFTKMNTNDIQEYIHQNRHKRICGHIKHTQLDSINLQISDTIFDQNMSFHRLFLLALLLAMGTSLLNCSDEKGQTKKIESIKIIENVIDSSLIKSHISIDSVSSCSVHTNRNVYNKTVPPLPIPDLDGLIVVTGDIVEQEKPPIHIDSIIEPQYPEIEGEIAIQEDFTMGMITVEMPPEFPNTPQNLTRKEKQKYFNSKINTFVQEHFNIDITKNLSLTGKQRIYVQFKIDKKGHIQDIKTRSPHPELEKEAIRVVKLLPKFRPGKQSGIFTAIIYNLPIIFDIED